jgi:hypothetical protein
VQHSKIGEPKSALGHQDHVGLRLPACPCLELSKCDQKRAAAQQVVQGPTGNIAAFRDRRQSSSVMSNEAWHFSPVEIGKQSIGGCVREFRVHFVCRPAKMRGQHNVREFRQRVTRWQRLYIENIQSSARDTIAR